MTILACINLFSAKESLECHAKNGFFNDVFVDLDKDAKIPANSNPPNCTIDPNIPGNAVTSIKETIAELELEPKSLRKDVTTKGKTVELTSLLATRKTVEHTFPEQTFQKRLRFDAESYATKAFLSIHVHC